MEARYLAGAVEVRAGNLDEGIDKLLMLSEVYPDFQKIPYSPGEAMQARGDEVRALAYYREALALIERHIRAAEAEGRTDTNDLHLQSLREQHDEIAILVEQLQAQQPR